MLLRGRSTRAEPRSPATSDGIRAPRPLPNPLRRATAHLLGQFPVGEGASGGRIEHDDRLPERGRLGQAHRSGHDVAAHLFPEVGPDFAGYLIGQLRAGVVHGEDDGAQLQRRVEIALDEIDVTYELAESFKGVVLALD